MAIDVNQIIAEETAARAKAEEQAKIAEAAAAKAKASKAANKKVAMRAEQKLVYANSLKSTIADYENRLTSYAIEKGRNGKLSPGDQKEFDKLVKEYPKLSANYQNTIDEANQILAKAPSPTKVSEYGGQVIVGKTAEEQKSDQIAGKTDVVKQPGVPVDDFAALLKNARQEVKDMSPADRLALATQLRDLQQKGIIQTKFAVSGEFTDALAQAYSELISGAQAYYNQYKETPTVQSYIDEKLRQYGVNAAAGLTGTGIGGYTPTAVLTSPTKAAAIINSEMKQAIGRDATPVELETFRKILNKIESANPQRRTGTKGGGYTYSGTVDPNEVIRQLIENPQATDFASWNIDKRTAKSIINSVGKFNLASEFASRKSEKTNTTLEDLKKTAKDNGLNLSQAQLDSYSARLQAGEDVETLKRNIRAIVADTMPENVKKRMDAGDNLDTVYSPYKTAMSSILEIPYDQIDLNDPTLTGAITAEGNMPLYQYKQLLRQDPRWQFTDNAKQVVSDGLTQVLRDFGFMG